VTKSNGGRKSSAVSTTLGEGRPTSEFIGRYIIAYTENCSIRTVLHKSDMPRNMDGTELKPANRTYIAQIGLYSEIEVNVLKVVNFPHFTFLPFKNVQLTFMVF